MATYTLTITDDPNSKTGFTVDHQFDPPLPTKGFICDMSMAIQAGCSIMQNTHELMQYQPAQALKEMQLVELINRAITMHADPAISWQAKYERIFGLKITDLIKELGYSFEYADPDTTHEEDITTYVHALRWFKEEYFGE